jgi:hypothetical protein
MIPFHPEMESGHDGISQIHDISWLLPALPFHRIYGRRQPEALFSLYKNRSKRCPEQMAQNLIIQSGNEAKQRSEYKSLLFRSVNIVKRFESIKKGSAKKGV